MSTAGCLSIACNVHPLGFIHSAKKKKNITKLKIKKKLREKRKVIDYWKAKQVVRSQ